MAHYTKTPRHKKHIHPLVGVALVITLLGIGATVWLRLPHPTDNEKVEIVAGTFPKSKETEPIKQPDQTAPKPTSALLTEEESASITAVVNKKNALPESYVPELVGIRGNQLRPEAATALEQLFTASEKAGMHPKIISAYRSYATQVNTYNGYVVQNGQAKADTFSARPGHSEHQTGLAVDVGNSDGTCELEICFGTTDLGLWVTQNASAYGFIVRYPEGKEMITGYQYEPWHLRYIGNDVAKAVIGSTKTLDEYFGKDAGDYAN